MGEAYGIDFLLLFTVRVWVPHVFKWMTTQLRKVHTPSVLWLHSESMSALGDFFYACHCSFRHAVFNSSAFPLENTPNAFFLIMCADFCCEWLRSSQQKCTDTNTRNKREGNTRSSLILIEGCFWLKTKAWVRMCLWTGNNGLKL